MKRISPVAAAAFVLLAGCATTQSQEKPVQLVMDDKVVDTVETSLETADPEAVSVQVPAVDLTGDVLYEVLLAEIAYKRGHLDVAMENYYRLARTLRDPRLAERATRLAVYARNADMALKAARLWVSTDPQNMEARQRLTAQLIQSGELDEALVHLEEILKATEQQSENGFMVVAGLLSREQDKRAALDVMGRLVNQRQDDPDALYAYGFLALRLGEVEVASETMNRVLALRPDWTLAMIQHARILSMQGDNDAALKYLEDAVKRAPDAADLRLLYARMLADQDALAEAYVQFKALSDLRPENDDALFALSIIALQLERLDDAERYLTRLDELGTRGYEVNYYLGRLAEMRGDAKDAMRWYASIGSGEYYMNAQIRIAALMADEGDVDSARAHVNALKVQRPAQKLRLYLVEGEILYEAGRHREAMAVYNAALEEIPDNTDLLYSRSMVAEKLDLLDLMEADLRKILERDPNNAEALNALGYSLADRTDRLEEARELVGRALELRPHDYYIIDSMGWIEYRLGNFDEAVRYLRRALEIKMDPEVAAHLGEVLWVMGNKDGAREVWNKALEAGNNRNKTAIIQEVMRKFDQ